MDIRSAAKTDASGIQELLLELVRDDNVCVIPDRLEEVGRSGYSHVLVAELEGVIVATAQVTFCPDIMYKNQPYALAENIVVKESERGRGIGKALVVKIEEMCKERNCSKIMLLSSQGRNEAHAFFEKMGYSGSKKKGFIKYRSSLVSGHG